LPPANKGSRQRALCHLPRKAVDKEPFATCQQRQSAKNFCFEKKLKEPLPPANQGSRQRNSIIKKIKKAFADCRVAVGKRDALRHLTTAFVSFADCHTGFFR